MKSTRTPFPALFVLLLGASAAACGGSSKPGDGAGGEQGGAGGDAEAGQGGGGQAGGAGQGGQPNLGGGGGSGGSMGGAAGVAAPSGWWVLAAGGDFANVSAINAVQMGLDGTLTPKSQLQKAALMDVSVPSYITANAAGNIVYGIDEYYGGFGRAFAISVDQKSGALTYLNEEFSSGPASVHVVMDTTAKYLFVANFNGKSVDVFKLQSDGKVGALSDTKPVGNNPHGVFPEPSGKGVFVPCMASNDVYQFSFDAGTGKLTKSADPLKLPNTGPRHMAFSKDGTFAYLVQENANSVAVLKVNRNDGTLMDTGAANLMATVPADAKTMLAGNTLKGRAAEGFVHPNGKFLYTTSRLDTVNGANTTPTQGYLGWFAIKADGTLAPGNFVKVGNEPRGFNISPDGTLLVVANQKQPTNNLMSFALDATTGQATLKSLATIMNQPMMVVVVPAKNER
ncbi:MAG: beta-propeller fold lactonase family protein [Deltaproteobacteria bacterium]|nr:beta-propeller fold lactonase family protein [Deltaproteobacteria bacterium]